MATSEKSTVKPLLLMIAVSALAFAAGMAIHGLQTVEAQTPSNIAKLPELFSNAAAEHHTA
jgi:hypothetical protein